MTLINHFLLHSQNPRIYPSNFRHHIPEDEPAVPALHRSGSNTSPLDNNILFWNLGVGYPNPILVNKPACWLRSCTTLLLGQEVVAGQISQKALAPDLSKTMPPAKLPSPAKESELLGIYSPYQLGPLETYNKLKVNVMTTGWWGLLWNQKCTCLVSLNIKKIQGLVLVHPKLLTVILWLPFNERLQS